MILSSIETFPPVYLSVKSIYKFRNLSYNKYGDNVLLDMNHILIHTLTLFLPRNTTAVNRYAAHYKLIAVFAPISNDNERR